MMFAAVPPSRMMPWTRALGLSCCRHRPTELNKRDHGIEGVPPLPRIGRRVGLQPAEDHLDVLGRERVALDVVPVARVVQEGGIDAGEQAVIDHDLLAAPPFLGRRPQEHDLARKVVGDRGQGDRRADSRRGHRVVAATVAETRQRVVLGEDPDAWAVTATTGARRPDRRREAARRVLDLESVFSEDLGDPRGRLMLLEGRLRVGVDAVGEVDDLVPRAFHGGRDPGLEIDVWLGGSNSITVGHGSSERWWRGASRPRADGSVARRNRCQRSAESVASATDASARMNRAIGSSSAPCSRRTMKIATISPTQPPRRAARVQSP